MAEQMGIQEAFDRISLEYEQLSGAFTVLGGLICGHLVEHGYVDSGDLAERLVAYAAEVSLVLAKTYDVKEPNEHLVSLADTVRGLAKKGKFTVIAGGKQDAEDNGPSVA